LSNASIAFQKTITNKHLICLQHTLPTTVKFLIEAGSLIQTGNPPEVIGYHLDTTQDEWMDPSRAGSRKSTVGPGEIIEAGLLRTHDMKIRKSGKRINSGMYSCTQGNRSRGRQRRRGRTTSSSGQGWRLMKQQDRLRIEIVGEESYAPPTLHQEEGIERRRRRHLM